MKRSERYDRVHPRRPILYNLTMSQPRHEVYEIAFRRLDDYVAGMGSSKFQSSAWTPSFSKSIRERPQIEEAYIGASPLYDRCDACNRSGHTPTFEVYFKGSTYDRETLEEEEDDDESDAEDEVPSDVPKAGTLYRLGKFCMKNARQAHAFRHWKFHLNEWVVDYLKEVGELTPEKIVARDSWKIKKRRKDAERIVDRMEVEGEIKNLRRDFKNQISDAQNVNNVSPGSQPYLSISAWLIYGRTRDNECRHREELTHLADMIKSAWQRVWIYGEQVYLMNRANIFFHTIDKVSKRYRESVDKSNYLFD